MVPSYRGSSFLDPKVSPSFSHPCSRAHSANRPRKSTSLYIALLLQCLCLRFMAHPQLHPGV